jgi:hypothetical protein
VTQNLNRDAKGRLLPGSGGRQPGSRNKLQGDFIEALARSFAENGEAAIRIVFAERPAEYLKIIASVLPKEFLMAESSPLSELSDADLEKVIEFARAGRKAA